MDGSSAKKPGQRPDKKPDQSPKFYQSDLEFADCSVSPSADQAILIARISELQRRLSQMSQLEESAWKKDVEIERLKAQLKDSSISRENLKIELLQAQKSIVGANEEKAQCSKELQRSQAQISLSESEKNFLQDEVHKVRTAFKELEQDKQVLACEFLKLQSHREKILEEFTKERRQRKNFAEAMRVRFAEEIAARDKRNEEMNLQLAVHREEAEKYKNSHAALQKYLAELHAQLEAEKSTRSTELVNFQNQMQVVKNKLSAQSTEISSLKIREDQLRNQVAEKERRIVQWNQWNQKCEIDFSTRLAQIKIQNEDLRIANDQMKDQLQIQSEQRTQELHASTEKINKLHSEVASLEMEGQQLVKLQDGLEMKIEKMLEERIQEQNQANEKLTEKLTTIQNLENKISSLEQERSFLTPQLNQLQAQLQIQSELHTQERQASAEKINRLNSEVANLELEGQQLLKLQDGLEIKIEKMQEERLLEQNQANEKLTEKLAVIQNLENKISSLEQERSLLIPELKQLQDQLQIQSEQHTQELQASTEKINRLNSEVANLELEGQQLLKLQDRLEMKIKKMLEERIQEQNQSNEKLNSKLAANHQLENHLAAISGELIQEQQQKTQLENKISSLEQERSVMIPQLNQLEVLKKQMAILNKEKDETKQIHARREKRIQLFLDRVRKDKTQVEKITHSLKAEIELVLSLNPMRDLLKYTDFEMKRAQAQLIRTPTISVDRARLEMNVDQLAQQKSYLEDLLKTSEAEFQKKNQNLDRVISHLNKAQIPPPPPMHFKVGQQRQDLDFIESKAQPIQTQNDEADKNESFSASQSDPGDFWV